MAKELTAAHEQTLMFILGFCCGKLLAHGVTEGEIIDRVKKQLVGARAGIAAAERGESLGAALDRLTK